MNIISLVSIGIIGAILALVLKQYKPEYSIFLSILVAIFLLFGILELVLPLISDIKAIMHDGEISGSYITVLLKSVGICYLTQFACDICRDAGQNAICTKIELAGRVGLCIIALPLYKDLLNIVKMIIGKVT